MENLIEFQKQQIDALRQENRRLEGIIQGQVDFLNSIIADMQVDGAEIVKPC